MKNFKWNIYKLYIFKIKQIKKKLQVVIFVLFKFRISYKRVEIIYSLLSIINNYDEKNHALICHLGTHFLAEKGC